MPGWHLGRHAAGQCKVLLGVDPMMVEMCAIESQDLQQLTNPPAALVHDPDEVVDVLLAVAGLAALDEVLPLDSEATCKQAQTWSARMSASVTEFGGACVQTCLCASTTDVADTCENCIESVCHEHTG